MTPDQQFARWIRFASAFFALVFGYFLIADLLMPVTPEAMATRVVTKVAPQVSGQIAKIYVANNQQVQKGDKLFSLDSAPFELAVKQAKLDIERVELNNAQLDAAIAAATAQVNAAQIVAEQKRREASRLEALFQQHVVSTQIRDDGQSAATAAQANWVAAEAKLKELVVSRGKTDDSNLNVQIARNALAKAELNLSYTYIVASHSGVVTNLQLESGTYAAAGTPLIALVADNVDVVADFREKNLRQIQSKQSALIAFDSRPGQVFTAQIQSLDAGVSNGQIEANGRLATPTVSNRWVRDAQRMRLHFTVNDENANTLPSGARATVQLVPSNTFLAWLARAQIHLLSALHYIY
ncbi:HlyD family secretion protein (plasmid) [Pseudoalteromonas xiamenensis]|uniref:HlyD family secretion protein n=1 Tax=Pseudoalteromonas xiamenensis TaxID=882626 RepID=UPI0027E412B8|nr:HlyD family secretion protein [Pseudoalteromonas xiamenensis]WMN61644.1 HlyD family secretion protein [Pseudoalteromonas xiamenensis]